MSASALDTFIQHAMQVNASCPDPADCVQALAPQMQTLLREAEQFLQPEHFHSNAQHYARNLVYEAPDKSLSLYTLVWLPGQWTPVHDHGSWGVVGVVEGVLEERSFVRLNPAREADTGIELVRGGVILLSPGSVTSFVPNPDHIHITGVPADEPRALSLHLYGRTMNSFNIYNVAAGTRQRVDLAHNET